MDKVQSILETKGSDVATIDRGATIVEAADLMNRRRIGALVVTEGEKAVGIFTERDILSKVVAPRRIPDEAKVGEAMTSPMTCCRRNTSLSECRAVMTERGIRHLPVVEGGMLYGLISSRDIIAAEIAVKDNTIKYLETTIEELHEYLYTRT